MVQDGRRTLLDQAALLSIILVATVMTWSIVTSRVASRPARRDGTPKNEFVPSAPIAIGNIVGPRPERAQIAILEFTDFQCPFCGRFAQDVLPSIRTRYLASGRVVMAIGHLPLDAIHPAARTAAQAAECAQRQGHFWDMHDRLFADQRRLGSAVIESAAQSLGLDMTVFLRCLGDESSTKLASDATLAESLQVNATPTFFFGTLGADGRLTVKRRVSGMLRLDTVDRILEPLIESTKGS